MGISFSASEIHQSVDEQDKKQLVSLRRPPLSLHPAVCIPLLASLGFLHTLCLFHFSFPLKTNWYSLASQSPPEQRTESFCQVLSGSWACPHHVIQTKGMMFNLEQAGGPPILAET
jgi:hypothetical protein